MPYYHQQLQDVIESIKIYKFNHECNIFVHFHELIKAGIVRDSSRLLQHIAVRKVPISDRLTVFWSLLIQNIYVLFG